MRDAVHAGQHDVQHNQVEPIGPQAIQRRVPIRDLLGLEPRQRQMESDDLPDRRFIFDNQRSPGGFPWSRPCRPLSPTKCHRVAKVSQHLDATVLS